MHGRVWSCIVSAAQTWTVGVTGATGYAGGEVCRLLAGHPNLRLAGVHANSSAGRRLGELQPHLFPFAGMEVQPSDAESLSGLASHMLDGGPTLRTGPDACMRRR